MTVITIGSAAIARASNQAADYTCLNLGAPADGTGILTSVQVYVNPVQGTLTGFRVGTFFLVSGTTYQCRASQNIGTVQVGLQTIPVSLAVVIGDFLGCYWASGGMIERDDSGGAGVPRVAGEYIDPGDQFTNSETTRTLSLYGTGVTPAKRGWGQK